MTSTTPIPCPACGTAGTGNFCSACGAPVRDTACPACGTPLAAGARFCHGCGRSAGSASAASAQAGRADRRPWIVAGAASAALLGLLLFSLARSEPAPPVPAAGSIAMGGGAPPDLTRLTPRERFDRLYDRALRAAQSGDEASVQRFTPMALVAYEMLDSVDTDARYHAAVLRVHGGDAEAARALGDTIAATAPGHLFGYMAQGTSARWRKDEVALRRAYQGFLERYEAEMKAARPEYAEHRFSVEEFRKAAERGP